MTTYQIDSYACVQYTDRPGVVALIHLYDNNSVYRGSLYFHPDGTHLPDANEDTPNGQIFLRLPVSRFASAVDMLRNESPIRLIYNSPMNAYLTTGREPTGEEETP